MLGPLIDFWPQLVPALHALIALAASAHVVLHKRETSAAIGWVALVWLTPMLGAFLYMVFGINRIHRRARRRTGALSSDSPVMRTSLSVTPVPEEQIKQTLGPHGAHLTGLVRLVGDITGRPLVEGNRLSPLINGEEAFPAMLDAIDAAHQSITLSTYIFDNDRAGKRFVDGLGRAQSRGVEVRVLIDDVGSRYTWPSIVRSLRRAGVQVAKFLPSLVPWRFHYANLRCHRKILVVDGRIGFTGGMNIRDGHYVTLGTRYPVADLHFRLEGPVVAHLQDVFANDWNFCTGENLQGDPWFPHIEPDGPALARGIADGPDDDFDKLRMTMLGAMSCARSSLMVVTPYFLPDESLIMSLNMAAMRGVQVDIVLPEKNNLTLVQWASTALYWQLLERGCRIWLSPPPFDHTKLMLVDAMWALVGSTNWDPRSLRLNFEFQVECYDPDLAGSLAELVRAKIRAARRVTMDDVEGRSLVVKLRDGMARLASPYL